VTAGKQTKALKLLCDTNVFIASAAISHAGIHPDAEDATRLTEIARDNGHQLYLSRATRRDLERDSSPNRKQARMLQLRQWSQLDPIHVAPTLPAEASYQIPLSPNDEVDVEMLAALRADAVDILVTQDRRLREAAARLGMTERAHTLQTAIEYLERLAGKPVVYPTIDFDSAYQLDTTDPLFTSLRDDYAEFDDWFAKACREHRQCVVIRGISGEMEALAILKDETDRPHDIGGKVLKVCTLKVADHATGAKRGELLLKAIFSVAEREDHDAIYVEVFPNHSALVHLLGEFGFNGVGAGTPRGELVLVKSRRPTTASRSLPPLEYHRLYGPPAVIVDSAFVVPVEPRWHNELFPEGTAQQGLFAPGAHGNALRKAYLCRAVTNQLAPGATLLFYRSHDEHAVTVVGVVESTHRLADAGDIRRVVGQRTVYSDRDIERLATAGPVLVVLFRQDRLLDPAWTLDTLVAQGVLSSHPQSITQATEEVGLEWIRNQFHG
jgi:hypothetical protein